MIAVIFTLMAMGLLAPGRDHTELGGAIARVTLEREPLFKDDESKVRTVALLVAVSFRESSLRNDAVGDHGRSVCAMQILNGSRSLIDDADACVSRGYDMIRESFAVCRALPVEERLALYARGRCDSVEGRRISRDRFAIASRLVREVRP